MYLVVLNLCRDSHSPPPHPSSPQPASLEPQRLPSVEVDLNKNSAKSPGSAVLCRAERTGLLRTLTDGVKGNNNGIAQVTLTPTPYGLWPVLGAESTLQMGMQLRWSGRSKRKLLNANSKGSNSNGQITRGDSRT